MAFSIRATFRPLVTCNNPDADHLLRAAKIADRSGGLTAPHPNFGCVIAQGAKVVGEGYLYAHGSKSAEIQAVESARELAKGATAYLNLEPHVTEAVSALCEGGIDRIVVGLRNPVREAKGKAIEALRSAGKRVDIWGEAEISGIEAKEAAKACREVNAPILYRSALGIPFSVLKYAMTVDGKIAASSGHAAWVSGPASRELVLELRSRSDAVVVGGNTLRRDDPQLTTRRAGGHAPVRIVMSASMDLPEEARLWDVSESRTIVATRRGSRRDFQRRLAAKGVEVVEFDPPTPRAVMERFSGGGAEGFLSVLWECGGVLSAPAIAGGVIHKVMAFVAPKVIGGERAPSPVGELGMVKMTDALNLADVCFQQVGGDMLITGYLHPIPLP